MIINIVRKKIPVQFSILGKLAKNKGSTKKELEKTTTQTKQQLSTSLGQQFQFGYFIHPDIGSLFIAGHLTPTFLTKVDENELASLPSGLLGIFRGLEIKTEAINGHLTDLKNGNYCLIIRVERDLLETIKPLLKK
ncbi:hypothetical protein ES044_11680 [Polaribacter sp. IC066]|nr:hypothetical protein ES044_11680 [Polaribacter sp. IC066]